MEKIEGYILVGGASSRMGRNKALLKLGRTTLGERAAAALREVTPEVFAVGREIPGTLFVPDLPIFEETSKRAAMVGLYSALTHSTAEWIAVLACDLPFVNAGLFKRLISIANSANDLIAVVPVQADGNSQPLAAIYRREPCRRAVEQMLAKNEMRLQSLMERVATHFVRREDYLDLDRDNNLFLNVNTPDDYRAALAATHPSHIEQQAVAE